MMGERFTIGRFGKPNFIDYLLALALAAAAVVIRAMLEKIAPGIAYFIALFPAVVLAGIFLGTLPAAVAAIAGGSAISGLFLGSSLLDWPPTSAAQINVLMFVLACAALLWATHALRRTVRDVKSAEARLAEVFRQLPGAAAILAAPHGRLLMRSAQSEAVLGQMERRLATSDELASYGGIHADGRAYEADDYPIVRALKTGEIVNGERIKYRRPSGKIVDLEVHAGPVRGPDGRIVASVGMAFDISDQMDAERRLRESETLHRSMSGRLRAAVDAGGLGLWEVDLRTDLISVDAKFAAMLGMPAVPTQMPRAEFRNYVDAADRQRVSSVFSGAAATGNTYADEVRMRTTKGDARWFVSRGAVLVDLEKVVGVVSDITERRVREDALQAALQARDVLMHEADHRIKNSLQMVVSMLRLQRAKVGDDAGQMLDQAIARVDAVANAHLALQRSPDLRDIEIDAMLEDLASRVGLLNTLVEMRCDLDARIWLDADNALPLGLLVSEVLTNALRHAFPSGMPGHVRLAATANPTTLEVLIADDGIGLPSTPAIPGLGTNLVAALAKQIGATLVTKTSPGNGTQVTIRVALPNAG